MFGPVLAVGSSSVVYKAWDVENLRFVAVKRVSVFQQAKRRQVARELHSLQRLGVCPQIVGFHGAFYEEGTLFYISCLLSFSVAV